MWNLLLYLAIYNIAEVSCSFIQDHFYVRKNDILLFLREQKESEPERRPSTVVAGHRQSRGLIVSRYTAPLTLSLPGGIGISLRQLRMLSYSSTLRMNDD